MYVVLLNHIFNKLAWFIVYYGSSESKETRTQCKSFYLAHLRIQTLNQLLKSISILKTNEDNKKSSLKIYMFLYIKVVYTFYIEYNAQYIPGNIRL